MDRGELIPPITTPAVVSSGEQESPQINAPVWEGVKKKSQEGDLWEEKRRKKRQSWGIRHNANDRGKARDEENFL